jgi:hypothetical protein
MMDPATEATMMNLLSSYIVRMDAMRRTQGTIFATRKVGFSTISEMNDVINSHARQLMGMFPVMNLDELTAFSELVNSFLAQVRTHITGTG